MGKMVREAEDMREADIIKKDTVQARNDAETLGYSVDKQLTDLKDKISKVNAEELKQKVETLRTYMTQDDVDLEELKEKAKDLQELSWKVTQEVYQQASTNDGDKKRRRRTTKRRRRKRTRRKRRKRRRRRSDYSRLIRWSSTLFLR